MTTLFLDQSVIHCDFLLAYGFMKNPANSGVKGTWFGTNHIPSPALPVAKSLRA
jgi:hypothetical protein